jgi:hypothetical protein
VIARARAALAAACAVFVLTACTVRPPSNALVVRQPERKCALVRFSFCKVLLASASEMAPHADADAGAE